MNGNDLPPPPPPLDRLRQRQGYVRPPLPTGVDLRLDGNEGARPDPALLRELADTDPELLRRYPRTGPLQAELASRLGVAPDRVLVLAGGDEVLDRCFRAYAEPGRRAVWTEPSFEMLARYGDIAGCEVRNPRWDDGPYPLDEVLAACEDKASLVFLVTPNNPSGAIATAQDLEQLCQQLPNSLVVLDHAYVEFADEDLTEVALRHRNALVVRTLSKACGLAGLRIGYAVGDPEVLAVLRAAGGPYSVAAASIEIARAALRAGSEPLRAYVERVQLERTELTQRLRDHGLHVPDSEGNFVLARGPRAVQSARALLGLGIAIRPFPGRAGLEDAVRITCAGNASDHARLMNGLESALAPRELLLPQDSRATNHPVAEQLLAALDPRLPIRRLETNAPAAETSEPGWLLVDRPEHVELARQLSAIPLLPSDMLEGGSESSDALTQTGAMTFTESRELTEMLP